jgi:hypothetical protein
MPFRGTDDIILIISHGAVIAGLKGYLRSQGYNLHESIRKIGDTWDGDKRHCVHCSVSEIIIGLDGPGQFIRVGDSDHLVAMDLMRARKFGF